MTGLRPTCRCGRPVMRCTQGRPDAPCYVRCLHERPRAPSRKLPCAGWVHLDGLHFCDACNSHTKLATPVKE